MNEIRRQMRPTTQAAEGIPRLRWTLAEFERLTELGIFSESDRIELIEGELVPMAPKGNRHELVRDELANWMIERLPVQAVRLSVEIGWRPARDVYVEPDLLLSPKTYKGVTVPPGEVLLVIEIADTSLRFDTSAKAHLYARLGVRDYWAINVATLETRVHREASAQGYRDVSTVKPSDPATPLLLPALAVTLADLDFG